MPGLYDETTGLSDGTGLYRGRVGLFSGAAGFINGSGGAYVDLYFSAGTYSVAGNGYTTLGSIPGFTFTRASLAMGYDATGKLTYGPNNLCLQSQTFDNASWTKLNASVTANAAVAPDGTTTADKLIPDAVSAQHGVYQGLSPLTGMQCVTSVYAKAGEYSWLYMTEGNNVTAQASFNLAAGTVGTVAGTGSPTATIESIGSGWYRCTLAFVPTANSANIQCRANTANGGGNFSGDGTSGIYLWAGQFECRTYQTTPSTYYPTTTAAYYGPRLVYDPVTLASQGILVEEARTNSAVQSQDFSTTWTLSRATVAVNATTSPDGTSNADKLIEDSTATNSHRLFGTITTTAAPWTFSVFAKADTRSWIYLRIDRNGGTTPFAWFDVANGVVGGVGTGLTASIQNVRNGWYRCIITVDAAMALPNSPLIGLATGDGVSSYSGDGTSGAFIWQAQLEAGTGASSPIPTTTASVTRAADAATVTGLSVPNPHSMAAEWTPGFDNASSFRRAGALSNSGGTSEDSIYQRHTNSFSRVYTSADMDLLLGTANATTTNKAAARFETNNSTGSLNGAATVAPDTATVPTTGIDRLLVGVGTSSTGPMNGTISRIRIYNRALSDAELQAATQSLLLQENFYNILQENGSYIWLE